MGGGACVATACDFRIGSDSAFMEYPEVNLGINLMWKSLPLILALVGPARTKRLVAGGERVSADTLYEWGILDHRTSEQHLLNKAGEMANLYASKPPIAVQMIKQSTNELAHALGSAIMAPCLFFWCKPICLYRGGYRMSLGACAWWCEPSLFGNVA